MSDGKGASVCRAELGIELRMKEYKAFKCPQCGGYRWGTSHCTERKDKWIGHCNGGNDSGGCGFTWHRATDDHLHIGVPLTLEGPMPNARANLTDTAR